MKQFIKKLLELTPYRVIRACDANRFQAIEESLRTLKRRGFSPRVVFDGGANIGDFTRLARQIFGNDAEIHMFEPQPSCKPYLEILAKAPAYHFHHAALGSTHGASLDLVIEPGQVTTGAHVAASGASKTSVRVPVVTLDGLFQAKLRMDDRSLLKLDLQGWELEAIRGAVGVLPHIEVILIEVSFYAQAYEPPISKVVRILDEMGFELQDVASLFGRPRDNRARQADFVFINRSSRLLDHTAWG